MKSLRFFIASALFTIPFFVFAQATTTAIQPTQTESPLSREINILTTDRLNLLPKTADIRTNAISNYLEIKTSPSNPGPSEMIGITIESYLSDMNKATISWSVNGRVVTQGIGKKSFSFPNGPSGETTRLTISIITNSGEVIIKDLSWTPVGVTLLWEADTYTPPFYKGKALISSQSKIRATALTDNSQPQNSTNKEGFVYVWEQGGKVISEASGYNKNSFLSVGPNPYDELDIKVRTSSIDNTINSESRTHISPSSPFILFYEKDPLLGVLYNKPFDTETTLNKKEFSISAEPYFFSNEPKEGAVAPTLKYLWSINGAEVSNYGRTIILRNDTGAKGTSLVSLAMRGITQTFQTASRDLQVNFTESSVSSRPTF